ncbi:hypothetical protein OROGR_006608 [Orobanche gracilis]
MIHEFSPLLPFTVALIERQFMSSVPRWTAAKVRFRV